MPTLENITKGNFNLEFTKKTYKHEHNLRFHIKVDEHYYEYAMDTINKKTINLQCVVHKHQVGGNIHPRCKGRITLIVAGRLKTQKKTNCNSKKPKYEWDPKNTFEDYLDIRNYAIQKHNCQKHCLKNCILKHTCAGHELSRDRKRTYIDVARNHNLANPTLETHKSRTRAEEIAFPDMEFEGQSAFYGISDDLIEKRLHADTIKWLESLSEKPWNRLNILQSLNPTVVRKEQFYHEFDDGMKIFCIPSELKLMNRFKVYLDGTFRTINSCYHPNTKKKVFCQNFIVTIKWTMDDKVFCYPLIYGLMPRRQTDDYIKFWQRIKAIFDSEFEDDELTFKSFSTDFEYASYTGFSEVFPGVPVYLCGFHFLQSLKRKLVKLFGKKNLYKDPVLLSIWIDILRGCMWIPWNDSLVQFLFDHLNSLRPKLWKKHRKPFDQFLTYLQNTYFGPNAMFPYSLWNHFD